MSVERNPEGAWIVSDIVAGVLVSQRYYGYTKREAIRLFKMKMKGQR